MLFKPFKHWELRHLRQALLLLAALSCGFLPAQQPPAADITPAPYLRLIQDPQGRNHLEVASRRFTAPQRPGLWLIGVSHLGHADYYKQVQKLLDAQTLVLYEGVGWPVFMGSRDNLDDAQRRHLTREAIRFVAILAEHARQADGKYPADLPDLEASTQKHNRHHVLWLREARRDGWNRPLVYQSDNNTLAITSFGADGREGGEGENADLKFSDQPPLTDSERLSHEGIQSQLAESLGLAFQLQAIDYDRAHFKNADISMDDLARALGRRAVPPDRPQPKPLNREAVSPPAPGAAPESPDQVQELMGLISGDSQSAQMIGALLGLVKSSPPLRELVKLILIESLGQIRGDLSEIQGLDPQMQKLLQVLIHQRNDHVLEEVKRALNQVPPPQSVAVFYGAGHMADLEKRLRETWDYQPAEDLWLEAITADLKQTGLDEAQLRVLRQLMSIQLQQKRAAP